MKPFINFVATTLIGGLLVLLPIWLTLLLLLKAIKGALGLIAPIVALVPRGIGHEDLVAIAILLALCFLAGLFARARVVRRFGRWTERRTLEQVPGYMLLRGIARQIAGKADEQAFQPALIEIEEALVPGFIIEQHDDGRFTVFVSSSPTPMAGAIYIIAPERVHPVDLPLTTAMACVSKWGAGSSQWVAAMQKK